MRYRKLFRYLTVEITDNNNGWNSRTSYFTSHVLTIDNSKINRTYADMQRNKSDKRLQNQKPFPKGISGNPAGRPKKALLSDALRRQLALAVPGMPEKRQPKLLPPSSPKLLPATCKPFVESATEPKVNSPRQSLLTWMLDWRHLAQSNGLKISDVLTEARILIESAESDSD